MLIKIRVMIQLIQDLLKIFGLLPMIKKGRIFELEFSNVEGASTSIGGGRGPSEWSDLQEMDGKVGWHCCSQGERRLQMKKWSQK